MSHEDIPVAPDRIPDRLTLGVLVGTVISIVACVFVVWILLDYQLTGDGSTRTVVELRQIPPAIPFEGTTPLETQRTAESMFLEHWSWADRSRGIVRMPIDRAIDLYLQQRGGK